MSVALVLPTTCKRTMDCSRSQKDYVKSVKCNNDEVADDRRGAVSISLSNDARTVPSRPYYLSSLKSRPILRLGPLFTPGPAVLIDEISNFSITVNVLDD